MVVALALGVVLGQHEPQPPMDHTDERALDSRERALELAADTPLEVPRFLEIDPQDYDSYLDDDDNLILAGAADQDFNTATLASGNEEKGGGEEKAAAAAGAAAEAVPIRHGSMKMRRFAGDMLDVGGISTWSRK